MPDQQPTSPIAGLLSSARGKIISTLAVIALLLGIFAEGLSIYRNFWETGTSNRSYSPAARIWQADVA